MGQKIKADKEKKRGKARRKTEKSLQPMVQHTNVNNSLTSNMFNKQKAADDVFNLVKPCFLNFSRCLIKKRSKGKETHILIV